MFSYRTQRIVSLPALVLLLAAHLIAQESEPILLSTIGETFNVHVSGLTEGLTVKSKVQLRNETGRAFTSLLAKVSCGCLKPKGIDGSEISSNSERDLEFVFLPTPGAYHQTCTISGVDASENRRDLVTFAFKGNVESPVRLDRRTILPAELEKGSFTTGIHAVEGVEIDFAGISSDTKWMTVISDAESKTIRLAWQTKPLDNRARISVPLRWRGNSYKYGIEIETVDELISVVPSLLIFRPRGNEKELVARVVLGGNGVEVAPTDIVVCNAEDKQPIEFANAQKNFVKKAFGKSKVMIEWRLEPGQLDQSRDKSVVFRVGDVFTNPMRFSFQ